MPTITISQFSIPKSEARVCEPLLSDFPEKAKQAPGFISTSVWRHSTDMESFLRLTVFENQVDSDSFYDRILKSDSLVEAIQRFGIAPNVTQFSTNSLIKFDPARVHESEFLSFSLRALDPGMESEWVQKLKNNLTEVSSIGGFEGAMIGTETDSSARVAGLAFWQTAESFARSVPSNPDYEIKLYSLYR